MDFTSNRNAQPSARTAASDSSGGGSHKKDPNWKSSPGWLKIVWLVLLFAGTIMLVSIALLLLVGGPKSESKLIDEEKYQAVFMDNNQVYFGKINTVNDQYMDLQGVYYLRVDQPVQPEQEGQQNQNITLQKLGCELHGPEDQMVINRDHITFWENLKSDGQVTQAIGQWLEQNPDGVSCDEGQNTNTTPDTGNGNNNGDTNGNTENNEEEAIEESTGDELQ